MVDRALPGTGAAVTRVSCEVARVCEHTFLISPLSKNAVVADLGANLGAFSYYIMERFDCGVVAAEPAPDLWLRLARQSRLKVLPVAIAGHSGTLMLKTHQTRCASGLFALDCAGVLDTHEVEALSFGDFLIRANLARIDLAKVDIEGSEIAMFDTASDADLLKVAQFTVEFHDFCFPELAPHVTRVKERLRALGFACINFSRDNTDVLFVNRALLELGALRYTWLRSMIKYRRGLERRIRRSFARPATAPTTGVARLS